MGIEREVMNDCMWVLYPDVCVLHACVGVHYIVCTLVVSVRCVLSVLLCMHSALCVCVCVLFTCDS